MAISDLIIGVLAFIGLLVVLFYALYGYFWTMRYFYGEYCGEHRQRRCTEWHSWEEY
jgi:hypothetical protein